MSKIKFELTIDTTSGEFEVINTDTGERKTVSFKNTKKSPKKDESSEPTLILETNKYCLNSAAVELMQLEPDCKLDIKYEKQGNKIIPVIGTDESFGTHSGCKLTKSLSVACRGSKNTELAKYGTEFIIVPHEAKNGIFILKSKDEKVIPEPIIEDTIVDDIQDLIDNQDVTEIDSTLFQL